MNPAQAPEKYNRAEEDRSRDLFRQEIDKTFKKGGTMDIAGGRLILTDTVTSDRYELTVASGVLTITVTTL